MRVSGRLVSKAVKSNNTPVKRKLDYENNKSAAKPTVTVSILKHKHSFLSKRRSLRKSRSSTDAHTSRHHLRVNNEQKDGPEGLVDLSTYTVFQDIINDKTTCRSSMNPSEEFKSRGKPHNEKFFLNGQSKPHMTPLAQKGGKENQNFRINTPVVDPVKSSKAIQPGNDVFRTPTRLTRSASKQSRKAFDELNVHTPLSANKILTKSKMHVNYVR